MTCATSAKFLLAPSLTLKNHVGVDEISAIFLGFPAAASSGAFSYIGVSISSSPDSTPKSALTISVNPGTVLTRSVVYANPCFCISISCSDGGSVFSVSGVTPLGLLSIEPSAPSVMALIKSSASLVLFSSSVIIYALANAPGKKVRSTAVKTLGRIFMRALNSETDLS